MLCHGLRIGGFCNPTVHEITAEGVRPWPGAALPAGRSAFQHFFAPIFPYLDSVFLLSDSEGSPFLGEMDEESPRWIVDIPVDESLPSQVLEQPRPILHRPGTVSAWSDSFFDDWCTLIDLGPSEEEAVRIATTLVHLELEATLRILGFPGSITQEESRARFRGTVLAEARSVLQCIDGLLWDLYTEDAALLSAVETHARSSGLYAVRAVPLEECLKW